MATAPEASPSAGTQASPGGPGCRADFQHQDSAVDGLLAMGASQAERQYQDAGQIMAT